MLFYVKTIVSLKCFVSDCLWKPFLDCKLAQAPLNLILLTILVTVLPRIFTWFWPKVGAFDWGWHLLFKIFEVCFRTLCREINEILHSSPKYFWQAVVFLWSSTLREKFNFHFWRTYCKYGQNFTFGSKIEHGAIILWKVDIFLIFPNFLRS